MTRLLSAGREGMWFGRTVIVAASLSLASCVPTVTYSPSPGTLESAQRALAAERALTHPQTVALREADPGFAPMTFCTADGSPIDIREARVTENGICGRRVRLLPTAVSGTVDPERCWSFAEIRTIGQPRDGSTFGYFAVRGSLRCPQP